jgi:hypothetical protein
MIKSQDPYSETGGNLRQSNLTPRSSASKFVYLHCQMILLKFKIFYIVNLEEIKTFESKYY